MVFTALLGTIAACVALSTEHRFVRTPIKMDEYGYSSSCRLDIERIRDGKRVFRRTFASIDAATLDPKGTSIAFTDQRWIFVWKPDQPMRRFGIPKLPDGFGEGVYEKGGLMWSPDSRSLLVWIPGTQGSMILGHGELFALETATGRTRYIDSVAKPRWVTARIVEYWKFHHDEREMSYYSVLRRDVLNPMSKARFQRWEFPDWGA